jgi:hypothetical protein
VALFVLILVGVVVAQTWFDWRDTSKARVIPEWAKGMALGGLIAVPLAAAAAVVTIWMREDPEIAAGAFGTRVSWSEIGFIALCMSFIFFAVRKKGYRFMLLLAGVVIAAFWIGLTI